MKFIGLKPKNGDTIPFINLFTQNKWNASLISKNKKIITIDSCIPDTLIISDETNQLVINTKLKIDTNLVNRNFVLSFNFSDDYIIKLNGNIISQKKIDKGLVSYFFDEKTKDQMISFDRRENLLEIILSRNDLEKLSALDLTLGTLSWKDKENEKIVYNNIISIIKLVFFFSIGTVVFIQFIFYRIKIENLYFSIFCFLYSLNQLGNLFYFSSIISLLLIFLFSFGVSNLVNYLSLVLTEKKIRNWPSWVLFICLFVLLVLSIFHEGFVEVASYLVTGIYILYNLVLCLYLLFQGGNKKKWESKYISYSFFLMLLLYLVFFILSVVFETNSYRSGIKKLDYFFEFTVLILPVTLAIIIGKRNGQNQNELILKYDEIKNLSEENIKKEKEKQSILTEQNQILETKVVERTQELLLQKQIVEEKQKEIIESINYAKRLQQAILPPSDFINSYLPNNFILYRPKDIIAGDFYWMEISGNLIMIAAADCTGHGVPGALVSVVCSNALNRAVKEFNVTDTGKVLDKTRELVLETFEKSASEVKDGMDISLLCIDKLSNKIYWSGANNPLWFIDSSLENDQINNSSVIEIKPDKQPIGKSDYGKPFTTHIISCVSNNTFYLFTDGYADQFGGPRGKKFKYKPLQDLLFANHHFELDAQAEILNKTFNNWKQDLEQVDDVCIIGVRI
ncbi:MAG: SpoIIE family protein phosphatase [Bacteroidota bacterium]